MKSKLIWAVFISIATLVSSCRPGFVYEQSISVDPEGWEAQQFAHFDVDIEDLQQTFDVMVYLRHDGRYPYANLYLFVNTFSPTGASIRDTLECILARPDGQWIGKGIGGNHSLRVPFKHQVKFPVTGKYRFEIQHGMRTKNLAYIKDIGISISKTK